MSFISPLRGVHGIVGRHASLIQTQQQMPAITHLRRTFASLSELQSKKRQSLVTAAAPTTTTTKSPFSIAARRNAVTSTRATTTSMTEADALKMLNEQRSLRPNSPHFTIYQPQLTWIGSIANRVTGVGLSACECRYIHMLLPIDLIDVCWTF